MFSFLHKCKIFVDGQLIQEVVAMKEIMISLLDKLECIVKFCYLADLIGASGGAKEASSEAYVVPGQSSGNWLQC